MSEQDAFDLVIKSLYRAMLDDARWPRTSALLEEACGARNCALLVGEGPSDDLQVVSLGFYTRARRCIEDEREYLETYHPMDESVPRLRRLPHGLVVPNASLFTEEELKTSATYNEYLGRVGFQDGLRVRLNGPVDCSHTAWALGDPVAAGGWRSDQYVLIKRLLPHVWQFVAVRQALARAGAQSASLTNLLDNRRIGVIHLDPGGKVIAANERARGILLRGHCLSDQLGTLRALSATDRVRFEQLLANALPRRGALAVGGSMALRGSSHRPQYTVHVKPVVGAEIDSGSSRRVGVLVLIADTGRQFSIDPGVVAQALGLTPKQSEVASRLAEGMTVHEIAVATGRQRRSIYGLLEQIFAKLNVRRQVDLVRLVLAVTEFG